jgi:adenylate cyclase
MSTDKANDYFSDGVTEEIIAVLSKVSGLKVASRATSLALKGKSAELKKIGEQLGVRAVLEGSVTKAGNELRIRLQLVNVADGFNLWTETYDRRWSSDDLIEIQTDIARQVATALKVSLLAYEKRQIKKLPTENFQAYEDYLRAKYYTRSVGRLERANNYLAIPMLERAVALDTNFALAFAELGRAYVDRLFYFAPTEKEWEAKARAATERAVLLDETSAEAHFTRGYFLWTPFQHFRHEEAAREFQRALALDPQLEQAFFPLALVFNHMGLLEEASEVAEQAAVINPLDATWRFSKGNSLLWNLKLTEALDHLSNIPFGVQLIGGSYRAWALFELGKTKEAGQEIEKLLKQHPEDRGGMLASVRAMLYAKANDADQAQQQILRAIEQRKGFGHFHHTAYNIACAYALMNDHENAIYWFKQAVEDGFNCYPLFLKDASLDSLRNVQHFKDLLAEEEKKYKYYKSKFGIGPRMAERK